jgi:hypothetical protein
MTHTEFDLFQVDLIKEVFQMNNTKGKEYSNGVDRFGNFNRLSLALGIPNITVGWIYLAKHLDSIASFVRNQEVYSTESIRGRIVDAITYLTLIAGMVEEVQAQPPVEVASNLDKKVCFLCNKEFKPYEWITNNPGGLEHPFHANGCPEK